MDHSLRNGRAPWRYWLFVGLLLVTALIRLGSMAINYQFDPRRIVAPDTNSYEKPALALLMLGRFAMGPELPNEPEVVRTPGYPLFLAGIYYLAGVNRPLVIIGQIILSLGTMLLVWWLARVLWGEGAALWGLGFLALDISGYLFSQRLLSETLFTFLLMAFCAAALRFFSAEGKGRTALWALGVSLLLAAATLVRPVSYYFMPVLVLVGAGYVFHQYRHVRAPVLLLALMVLPWLCTVGAWQARNYSVSGSAVFSHIQGENLLKYWAAEIKAQKGGLTREEAEALLRDEWGPLEQPGKTRAQVLSEYAAKSLALVKENLGLALKAHVRAMAGMLLAPMVPEVLVYWGRPLKGGGPLGDLGRLSGGEYYQKWARERPWTLAAHALALVFLLLVYTGTLAGLWGLIREKQGSHFWAHLFFWLLIIYTIAISAGPGAYGRVRGPIMPLFCMYAGWGWYWWLGARRKRKTGA